ncbi:MAG: hypothetical protein U1E34_10175 [Amaricoccus sp.]
MDLPFPKRRLYMLASLFPVIGETPHQARRKGLWDAVENEAVAPVWRPTYSSAVFESERAPDDLLRTIVHRHGDLISDRDRILLAEITGMPMVCHGIENALYPRGDTPIASNGPAKKPRSA